MIDLDALIAQAMARYNAMMPEEQAAMWRAQRESWVRGEMGIGNDRDEAEYRAALRARASQAKP